VASIVVGMLFLLAMFFSPLAAVIPAQATAPALILVGFYMMTIAREIPWDEYEEAVPAFVTMMAMPFTWSITNGIGAGFVTFAAIKLLNGKARQVHWMVYLASAAFVLYFALPLVEKALR
jgi:AGZA family xanthine/uracil permease-like MFS transporter